MSPLITVSVPIDYFRSIVSGLYNANLLPNNWLKHPDGGDYTGNMLIAIDLIPIKLTVRSNWDMIEEDQGGENLNEMQCSAIECKIPVSIFAAFLAWILISHESACILEGAIAGLYPPAEKTSQPGLSQ